MLLFINYNIGIFKKACLLRARTDIEFEKKFNTFFNLKSSDVQNEIISICCDIVKKSIVSQIEEVGFFAIMVDDAR